MFRDKVYSDQAITMASGKSMFGNGTKVLLFAGILLTGCTTTLTSTKIESGSDLALDEVGGTYYLPKQAINAAITYELRSCETGGNSPTPNVKISKSVAISTSNSPDGNARFYVPAGSLSSGNKTTSLTISTFDDGTLRSLGATIDDRTSESIGGIVNSAGSILGIATGATIATATGGTGGSLECNETIKKTIKRRDDLTGDLRDPNKFLGEEERAAAIDVLNRLTAMTRYTRNISFTPDPNGAIQEARVSKTFDQSKSTEARLNSWLNGSPVSGQFVGETLKTVICIRPGIDGGEEIANSMNRCGKYLNPTKLVNPVKLASAEKPSGQEDNKRDGKAQQSSRNPSSENLGLIYRDPKSVRVIVCGKTCEGAQSEVIGQSQVALAQFGPWRSIQLTSKAFQDKNVMASWNAGGRLTSLTFGSSSSLEALANTLNTSAQSISGTIGSVVTTDQEALNAEIALIRSQADLIEQRNRLTTLQNGTTDPTE